MASILSQSTPSPLPIHPSESSSPRGDRPHLPTYYIPPTHYYHHTQRPHNSDQYNHNNERESRSGNINNNSDVKSNLPIVQPHSSPSHERLPSPSELLKFFH